MTNTSKSESKFSRQCNKNKVNPKIKYSRYDQKEVNLKVNLYANEAQTK